MNGERYLALRREYPVFEYVDYHWNTDGAGLRLCFDFRMGDVQFHPEALIENRPFMSFADRETIDRIVFEIGMVELVSYWKCACAPLVRVLCAPDDLDRGVFWKKLYWHGLGEFFYTNGIETDQESFVKVEFACDRRHEAGMGATAAVATDGYLVPVGGGKDSVVSLELLRGAGWAVRPLIMNPRGATVGCAARAGFGLDETVVIRRTIDRTLLDLNAAGYLNGHTPFSAMLAFYTMLASVLTGVRNVALSNEGSANEPTVLAAGAGEGSDGWQATVNHQYSKSLEFEDDFREYALRVLPREKYNYFSFLRPLSELQIAMLFSRCGDYHEVFRSCNVGSKEDVWCCHCAKCLFAYVILSPFLEPERMRAIFGRDLLDDRGLQGEMMQLCGLEATKPFECVGTVNEVRQALQMADKRWYTQGRRPALMQVMKDQGVLDMRLEETGLYTLPEVGNLTPAERKILQEACTGSRN